MASETVKIETEQEIITLNGKILLFLKLYWKSVVVVLAPLIYLPIPIINRRKEYECMYVVLLMATFWVSEALPLPITSMIPIVLFPCLGILSTEKTCMAYLKSTNIMFLGGLILALGLEHSQLHKRIALRTVKFIGCSHKKLTFGLSFVTMFISMWISNSASAAMMVPITKAVLEVIEEQGLGVMFIKPTKPQDNQTSEQKNVANEMELPRPSDITICYFLLIGYSASIGGLGTLVGTGTNLTFKGIFEGKFPNAPQVDFLSFIIYNLPPLLVMEFLIWLSLQTLYMGMLRPNSKAAQNAFIGDAGQKIARKVIDDQYDGLGPLTWHEFCAGALFLLAVILFFFRSPGFIPGWADDIEKERKFIKDAVPSIFVIILMFVFPAKLDFLNFFRTKSRSELPKSASLGIVSWKLLQSKIPWGLLFLLGGGFALAAGSEASGMSKLIGGSLGGLKAYPPYLILLIVIVCCEVLTEFTSNVAIANIILPVLGEMAIAIEIHPFFLMFPASLACSMAFHMPVGTPPNAIVSEAVNIPVSSMAVAGIAPSLITIIVIWGSFPTWGSIIYPDTTYFPDWAKNITAT